MPIQRRYNLPRKLLLRMEHDPLCHVAGPIQNIWHPLPHKYRISKNHTEKFKYYQKTPHLMNNQKQCLAQSTSIPEIFYLIKKIPKYQKNFTSPPKTQSRFITALAFSGESSTPTPPPLLFHHRFSCHLRFEVFGCSFIFP